VPSRSAIPTASRFWPTSTTRSATSPRRSATAIPRPPVPVAPSTRSSAMNKLTSTPGCFGPDAWPDSPGWPGPPRRRRPRWGVAFHKDHDHPHDHMGRPGPARYAGPSRGVFTIGVAGPVGSGKTALVEMLCRALWPEINLAVITNDIYTHEDAEFL